MLRALIPAALLLAAGTPAGAVCTQANIAGTWTAYSLSQDDSRALSWTSCNLVISTAGTFTTAGSSCTASGQTVKVQGSAKLIGTAKCLYSGSISIPGSVTDPIPSLTLSMDKQTAVGVTGHNGAGNVSAFAMVKTQ